MAGCCVFALEVVAARRDCAPRRRSRATGGWPPRPHGRSCACAAERRRPPRPHAQGLFARAHEPDPIWPGPASEAASVPWTRRGSASLPDPLSPLTHASGRSCAGTTPEPSGPEAAAPPGDPCSRAPGNASPRRWGPRTARPHAVGLRFALSGPCTHRGRAAASPGPRPMHARALSVMRARATAPLGPRGRAAPDQQRHG